MKLLDRHYQLKLAILMLVSFVFLSSQVFAQEDSDSIVNDSPVSAEEDKTIPFRSQPAPSGASLVGVAGTLILGLALCVAFAFGIKKILLNKGVLSAVSGNRIRVLESKPIASKMTLFLVSVDDIDYLLVQNGEQVEVVKHDRALEEKNTSDDESLSSLEGEATEGGNHG